MALTRKSGIRNRSRRGQQGYILLMLMLFITLLAIFATSIAHDLNFEMKRDREEEMIHRGVQYSRAVRKFVKKFGRYPGTLEELENTNNIRFLRKRYKDPENKNKDFRLLHMGEVQLGTAGALSGATSVAQLAGAANAAGGAQNLIAAQGFANLAAQGQQQPLNQKQDDNSDASPDSQKVADDGSSSPNPAFATGPIVGVASLSKDKTIRVFNKKTRYNQWQFIYDPSMDRGGLLTTPFQPPVQVAAPNVNGQPGAGTNSFGGLNNNSNFGGNQLGPGGLPIQQQPQQPSQNPPQ
jgi:hypothetical protein